MLGRGLTPRATRPHRSMSERGADAALGGDGRDPHLQAIECSADNNKPGARPGFKFFAEATVCQK